jgi:hypothetical protein
MSNLTQSILISTTPAAVTQATSTTTAVTKNNAYTAITTFASTLAAGASEQFTFNNSLILGASSQIVLVTISTGSTTGIPHFSIVPGSITRGSCIIKNTNLAAAAALNGTGTVLNVLVLQ